MEQTLPSRDALKSQAKRLREAMNSAGTPMQHAKALEIVARQWGYRDWNTLSARLGNAHAPLWHVGQTVSGRYLGHRFTGTIKLVRKIGDTHQRLILSFDEPIDVVRSELFSSYRKQINCVISPWGVTAEKTSDGQPHLVLDLP